MEFRYAQSGCKLAKVLSLLYTCGESRLGKDLVPWEPSLFVLRSWVGIPTPSWHHFRKKPSTSVHTGLGGSRAHSLELSGPGPLGPLEIGQWGSVFIFQSLASEGKMLVFFHS